MITTDKSGVNQLLVQLQTHGVRSVVCSPGSRNAPLMIAFDEHPEFTCYVVHDERSAAFFALGIAQQTQAPVAICCTSGSAALNYYPAVAEAFYQCIPLVVLTADRPVSWVDQGDGQTIRQRGVFDNHLRYAFELPEYIQNQDTHWTVNRELAIALSECNGQWKGPIHINCPFTEPLYDTLESDISAARRIETVRGVFRFSGRNELTCLEAMKFPKKMILCGQLQPDAALLDQLHVLAQDTSWLVLVENTSNLVDNRFVHCIDRLLNSVEDETALAPDLLITIGGAIVSKRIKTFLRKNQPKQHWKIGYEFPYMDTYQCLTHTFQTEPALFLHQLNGLHFERNNSTYGSYWKQKDYLIQDKAALFFGEAPYSDLAVFETVLDYIPENAHIHMSNSSVVRYCQLFDSIKHMTYWANRGTSGIDGSSSTAVGAAVANSTTCHVLLTGDISFFYDVNALWNAYLPENLRIVLINNAGGSIFRIIPGPSKTPQLEQYFEAKHTTHAKGICETHQVDYLQALSIQEIEAQMEEFYTRCADGRPKLLEIFTPADENPKVLDQFFKFIRL